MIRGTPDRLLAQLVDDDAAADATYVEDFLLTHRQVEFISIGISISIISIVNIISIIIYYHYHYLHYYHHYQ